MNAVELLLAAFDEAYERRSWHGTNLRGSLRGMTAEAAAWRPRPGRHNAWELALHCAYWKYTVRRRLAGEKPGGFPLAGSNFFTRPEAGRGNDAALAADLALLADEHRQLRAAIAALSAAALARAVGSGGLTAAKLIRGVTAHDLYHAGQIQLLKRLRQGR